MAKRYDPVLGAWIHGLPDDAPEFTREPSEKPITFAFDGSWSDAGHVQAEDGVSFTASDEAHEFDSLYYASPQGRARTGRVFVQHHTQPRHPCPICWADPGECTHTGWDGNRSTIVDEEKWNAAIIDEEPIRIPPAERAGPAMIGDGVLRATVSGLSWMAVKRKLAAVDVALLELAKLHAPSLEEQNGKLVRPECCGCPYDDYGPQPWPCESATILLRRIELTERDLDYQLGDENDGEGAAPL